jgi:DNA invertase Pin-like site-specific DNA recombinase
MVQHNARQPVGAIRAAVMARVSTAEQARGDKTSLEDQIAKGRAEVAKRGWALHDTFTDVFTGASSDRPELAQIIAAACEGTIQAVVFTKVDRLARDLRDLLNIEAQLARHGVAIVATDQPIDTSTPAGRLLFQQLGSFAEFERSMIRDRTVNGQRREAAKGRWPGGTPPYGFRLAAGKLEHDPDEAKVVNKAAAMLVAAGSPRHARGCTEAGGATTAADGCTAVPGTPRAAGAVPSTPMTLSGWSGMRSSGCCKSQSELPSLPALGPGGLTAPALTPRGSTAASPRSKRRSSVPTQPGRRAGWTQKPCKPQPPASRPTWQRSGASAAPSRSPRPTLRRPADGWLGCVSWPSDWTPCRCWTVPGWCGSWTSVPE